MAFLDLPDGARIVDHRVSHGRLFLKIEVDRTPTAESAKSGDSASATSTAACPVCGYAESLHIPPRTGPCPAVDARRRGEGVYVDRQL